MKYPKAFAIAILILLGDMSRSEANVSDRSICPIPDLPKTMDPRNDAGLAAILSNQDLLKNNSDPPDKAKLAQAFLLFQQTNPHIPSAEYGDPDAAMTLWFLTQAGEKAMSEKKP